MRVLALTNLYPPHAIGGYEWSAHDVLRRFHERGHEVEVVTTTTRFPGVSDDEIAPFPVHRDLTWYWDDHELLSPTLRERLSLERRNGRRLRDLLRRQRPDVVSVWHVGGMSHGLLRIVADEGVPMVYAVCDEWPVYGRLLDAWGRLFADRPHLGRLAEALLGIPCRQTDLGPTGAWCFVSEHTRRACEAGSRFSFPRSSIVPLGVEPVDFPVVDPDGVEEDFGWRLLYVGRLDVRKGVLTAVDALTHLPETATLTLVGHGDARDAVLDRARALGVSDRVTVTVAARSELAPWYREADAFLFTSEWAEPFGLTPIEAMACATPVVGTGTGGSGDFLRDGITCLRYPPGDAAALAAAVTRLAGDPDLRRRLRRAGAALASAVTTDRVADAFEEWHLAAAAGYAEGQPADRPLPVLGAGA